jgi:dihydrofolate reductase
MIHIIVAASKNHVIGKDNKLLWHLPNDLKYFKAVTTGHPIIMGRKTFESIGKPLPNRQNIVVSRTSYNIGSNLIFAHSLDYAIRVAQKFDSEIFIIGGGEIYRQALPLADKIHFTLVDTTIDGDTFFPELNETEWEIESAEFHAKDEKHAFDYTFLIYCKKPN